MAATSPQIARDSDYQQGLSELDAHQWREAIASFRATASRGKLNADAALYWMAYAQARNHESEAALKTLGLLRSRFPASRWLKDGQALEFEVRTAAGYPMRVGLETDAGVKLMAANTLMQSDPATAFPVVQKVLTSNDPERVKEQALFVLAQNSSPEASKLLTSVATGNSNPALQLQAIRLMGLIGTTSENKASQRSFPNLLEMMARKETDPSRRIAAIQSLTLMRNDADTDLFISIFESDKNPGVRSAVLNALSTQQNGKALVTLAKQEKDPQVKAQIIGSMATVNSKDVTDYLVGSLK
jgi:HEAT repeat protein